MTPVRAMLVASLAAFAVLAPAPVARAGDSADAQVARAALPTGRDLRGYTLDGRPAVFRSTVATAKSCATIGPPATTFAFESFTRRKPVPLPPDNLFVEVVVTGGARQAGDALAATAHRAAACFSAADKAPRTRAARLTAAPAPRLRGADRGVAVHVTRAPARTLDRRDLYGRQDLTVYAYQVGRVIVIATPFTFAARGPADKSATVDTTALRATAVRACQAAAARARRP